MLTFFASPGFLCLSASPASYCYLTPGLSPSPMVIPRVSRVFPVGCPTLSRSVLPFIFPEMGMGQRRTYNSDLCLTL